MTPANVQMYQIGIPAPVFVSCVGHSTSIDSHMIVNGIYIVGQSYAVCTHSVNI